MQYRISDSPFLAFLAIAYTMRLLRSLSQFANRLDPCFDLAANPNGNSISFDVYGGVREI